MKKFLWLLLLSSCVSETSWKIDSIATGNTSFDSSRLLHQSPSSPLCLELIRTSEEVFCFLSLKQFRFHPLPTDPPTVKAQFTVEGETFEESLPLTAGQMRLRLPSETTEWILSSLQEGKKIVILIDGFEETLLPENFQKIYEKWKGKASFFKTLFKGPLE